MVHQVAVVIGVFGNLAENTSQSLMHLSLRQTRQFYVCIHLYEVRPVNNSQQKSDRKRLFLERITLMGRNHRYVLMDLAAIDNWAVLAADVHYQASLLARLFKVTPRRPQREFRRQLNTSPQRVLDAERAKDIRRLVEFNHDSQVCRQFHIVFGTSLKEFREKAS
jgi:AraC-like DNA-binding protein